MSKPLCAAQGFLLAIAAGYPSNVPFSMAVIMSTRRWCLPPSNSAVSQWRAIIFASSVPTTRAPMVRILLLLCRLLSSALYTSLQVHTRMPFTLPAAMPMPMPVPQARAADQDAAVAFPVRHGLRGFVAVYGIVIIPVRGVVVSEILPFQPHLVEHLRDLGLQGYSGVVTGKSDHRCISSHCFTIDPYLCYNTPNFGE